MPGPNAMFVWLKRGLLGLLLLVVVLTGGVYFLSAKLLEVALDEALEGREARYQLKPVRWRLSGLELELVRYEEPGLTLESLAIYCPWSQLWSLKRGFQGELHCQSIHLQLAAEGSDVKGVPSKAWGARMAEWASLIDSIPLQALELGVDRIVVDTPVESLRMATDLTFLKAQDGQTHLSATVRAEAVELQMRLKVLAGGQGLALDFVATAGDWTEFETQYLEPWLRPMAEQNGDLFLNPLGAGRGFLDVSGYARWSAASPDALSFTALADLGAGELYLPKGELFLRQSSIGLARDGMGRLRTYVKGGIASGRWGNWLGGPGEWAVKVDDARVAAELRMEDGLALSLGHADWESC